MNPIESMRSKLRISSNRLNDLDRQRAGTTVSTCRIKVNDTGVAEASFNFACRYSQVPSITFGYELQSEPAVGKTPLFSGSVVNFKTEERPPHSRLYTGATLRIVSENVRDVSFVVIATATGIAFTGPVS